MQLIEHVDLILKSLWDSDGHPGPCEHEIGVTFHREDLEFDLLKSFCDNLEFLFEVSEQKFEYEFDDYQHDEHFEEFNEVLLQINAVSERVSFPRHAMKGVRIIS